MHAALLVLAAPQPQIRQPKLMRTAIASVKPNNSSYVPKYYLQFVVVVVQLHYHKLCYQHYLSSLIVNRKKIISIIIVRNTIQK